jgi:lipopolysaccharide export system permease protein
MTLLSRYILRQNLFLLLLICVIGLGVYVFIDLFDRLDNFLEAGVGAASIAAYYFYSLPFILAQIFPAVFLIALMVQLGLMLRGRELLALEACAVSMGSITKTVLGLAAVLCVVQFLFSQVLGASGHKAATRIWDEEVRNRRTVSKVLHNVWFREEGTIVRVGSLMPAVRAGEDLDLYVLEPDDPGRIREILRAKAFQVTDAGWELASVIRNVPGAFTQETLPDLRVDLKTDVRGFLTVDPKANLDSLPLWQLGLEIDRLRDSGSNIERLLTAWHMKLAYSCSVLIMALVALAILSVFGSLYVVIPTGLVVTFCYYGLFMIFVSAGEKGLLPPVGAAWAANGIFAALAGGRILYGRSFYVA